MSINIFWRPLDNSFYQTRDLYGNRDLIHGEKAIQLTTEADQQISQLPAYYQDFYRRKSRMALKPEDKKLTKGDKNLTS